MLLEIRIVIIWGEMGCPKGDQREVSWILIIIQVLLTPVCSVHENSSSHTLDDYLIYSTAITSFLKTHVP